MQVLPVTRGIEKPARADWGVFRRLDPDGWPHWQAPDFSGIQDPPWRGPTPHRAPPSAPEGMWTPPDLRPGACGRGTGGVGRRGGGPPGPSPPSENGQVPARRLLRSRCPSHKGPGSMGGGSGRGASSLCGCLRPVCTAVSAPPLIRHVERFRLPGSLCGRVARLRPA